MKYQRQPISAYLFMLSISISSNANEQRLPITINPPLDSEIIEMLWKPSGLLYTFQNPCLFIIVLKATRIKQEFVKLPLKSLSEIH